VPNFSSTSPRRSSVCSGSLGSAKLGTGPAGMSAKNFLERAIPSPGFTSPNTTNTALFGT
jgi:hypothetical protein